MTPVQSVEARKQASKEEGVGGVPCSADASPDFGVGSQLHHVIAAEPVLPALLAVVGADGFAIQEGAVEAAGVGDLPAALPRVPPDDHMVARHLCVRHRQGVVLQPPHSHLLTQKQHVSNAVHLPTWHDCDGCHRAHADWLGICAFLCCL